MFIAIDIGNTNITVGVTNNDSWQEYRMSSEEVQPLIYYTQQLAAIAENIDKDKIEGVGVSSVVPNLTEVILDATKIELHHEPILFQKKWYHLLPIKTTNPEEIGTDLLANALAGYLKNQGPCLIVDFGTALTYTLVDPEGHLGGVAIAPGIRTSMESLSGNAAQLPEIPLELPQKPLGTNTVEAMNSGILWGFVGQVTFMIDKIKSSIDYNITTIATGGLSEVLKPLEDKFDIIDRNLTIQGIYEFIKLVQADQNVNHEDS
jgi:type III pantothenate kinase